MTEPLSRYLHDLTTHASLHGVLGVFTDGQPVALQAFGLADARDTRPNTLRSRFPIGSLSKSVTAAAILILDQQQRLGLDDAAHEYLPDCGLDARITLRHLLRHRSGLDNHTALPDYWTTLMRRPQAPDTLIRRVTALPLLHEPGAASRYSNTGYTLLARVAEIVSGTPLSDLFHTLFWQPLGLARTGGLTDADTTGHELDIGRPPAPPLDPGVAHGAYGLTASAQDLARWWQALVDGRVLDASRQALMLDASGPASTSDRPLGGFGYGWWLDERQIAGQRWRCMSHKGDVNGHTAMLMGLPDARTCAVALFNTASTPAAATARRLLGLALGEPWDAYPAALPAVKAWASGIYRDTDGTRYDIDTDARMATTRRDYGAPCRYAIQPYAETGSSQSWRANDFDERLHIDRPSRSLTVTQPDGSARRYVLVI